jgi:hypothetical protein
MLVEVELKLLADRDRVDGCKIINGDTRPNISLQESGMMEEVAVPFVWAHNPQKSALSRFTPLGGVRLLLLVKKRPRIS